MFLLSKVLVLTRPSSRTGSLLYQVTNTVKVIAHVRDFMIVRLFGVTYISLDLQRTYSIEFFSCGRPGR